MLLSARILKNVADVNTFQYTERLRTTQGNTYRVYFQLVDMATDPANEGFSPAGRRYVPEADATLEVVLENIDDDVQVTRMATAPFAGDKSIWYVQVTSSDDLGGTVNMRLTLTEDGVDTHGSLQAALAVQPVQGF